jgi:hypothetical protein
MKELPSNMTISHFRGNRSFVDAHYQGIRNGYQDGKIHTLMRKIAVDGTQVSEEDFKTAFDIALVFAQGHLGLAHVYYTRYDLDKIVNEENKGMTIGEFKTTKMYDYEQRKKD